MNLNIMDSYSSVHDTNGENGRPPTQTRQRAKQACEPCRLRKRRCDGSSPCNMCSQFEYKCYFEKHPRKRSKIVEQNAIQEGLLPSADVPVKPEPPKEDRSSREDFSKQRSMEANSGIAFTRLLGMRLDPSSGPKLFTFGWNLGSSTYTAPQVTPIVDFVSQDQMLALARLYFTNCHPLWGFLDEKWVLEQLKLRWIRPDVCRIPDHMLAGLVVVGSLFADGTLDPSLRAKMPQIAESAKLSLEGTTTMQPVCLIGVQSWLLRVLYLRATDHPHATWMATSICMHLVESTGIYQEGNSSAALHPQENEFLKDPDVRRRTFWVARMLNTWVSFEYGRTRVAIRGINCELPTPRDGDYTTDYINLYSLASCLDPDRNSEAGQWELFLRQLEEYEARHDGVELTKAHLGLCGYRRLRLANPTPSSEIITRIINIGLRGLDAAHRMTKRGMPWWHVANVPFQVICIFLAMDVRESLAHVATALRTLEEVVERFNTSAMKEALKTARFLVRLSKKRKDEDSAVLGQSLKKDLAECDPQPENIRRDLPVPTNGATLLPPFGETPGTTSSGDDWNLDVLNASDFDWNYFLTNDMPAFNSFAPDGTM